MTYQIWAKYEKEEWEMIEEGIKHSKTVEYLLKEYKIAYGVGWKFKVVKVRGEE